MESFCDLDDLQSDCLDRRFTKLRPITRLDGPKTLPSLRASWLNVDVAGDWQWCKDSFVLCPGGFVATWTEEHS